MSQTENHRLLSVEARFQSTDSPCGTCGAHSDTGEEISPSTWFQSAIIHYAPSSRLWMVQ
jgi:hypothetical protein